MVYNDAWVNESQCNARKKRTYGLLMIDSATQLHTVILTVMVIYVHCSACNAIVIVYVWTMHNVHCKKDQSLFIIMFWINSIIKASD